ncbi:MAG: ABC transporter permease [Candidatus Thorarchaeota archaeon]|jgi:putative ABC transport system permease protein
MQEEFDWFAYFDSLITEDVLSALNSYLAALILLVMLVLISRWQGIGIGSKLIVGTIRGTAQIILMALILIQIFNFDNIFLILLVLTIMCLFAAYTAKQNLEEIPGVFSTALPGILVGGLSVMILAWLLGVVELSGEMMIPMGGMVIGNAMNISALVIDRMWSNAQKQRNMLESALSLGASSYQATELTIRESLRTGLLPNLNRYAALGIVAIPGFMSGLIVGGASPIFAALYQVIVFIMILLACVVDGIIVSRLFLRQMFNEQLQLTVPPPNK